MNLYFEADVYRMSHDLSSKLANISSVNSEVASSTYNIGSNINMLNEITEQGFQEMTVEMNYLSDQISELVDFVKDFGSHMYLQNKERNHLLASIDATLKAPNKTSALEKYDMAVDLISRGAMMHAERLLVEAIDLNPLHYRSYIQLANLYMNDKEYGKALEYAKESIFLAPKNYLEIMGYTYYLLARLYEKNNDLNNALIHIQKAMEQQNNETQYFYEEVRYLALLNEGEEALSKLQLVIESDPQYFGYALVDSAFKQIKPELESVLLNMKRERVEYRDKIIHTLSNLTLPDYDYTEKRNTLLNETLYKLENGFAYIARPNKPGIPYNYHSLINVFQYDYEALNRILDNLRGLISSTDDSYFSLCRYVELVEKQCDLFNNKRDEIIQYINKFRPHGSSFRGVLRNEIAVEEKKMENYSKEFKKHKKPLGLFMNEEDKRIANFYKNEIESCSRKLESLKQAMEYEKDESLEIQRFCDEVLHEKKLPILLGSE
ncbi:tetratricopeptide repeat protein [Bacillus niameyensis]|uniref:tetratricopeptide repeat protein n=1 Tax=Bacillus niameyensis TaxID=1522308 RepID=UPI000781FE06|nr:hypothetical protein [Bacillus niameyensis]